jgi:hypothetical protein
MNHPLETRSSLVPAPTLGLLRVVLIGLNLIASASFLAELIFLRHFNEGLQYIPIVATALGLVGTLAALSRNILAQGITVLSALVLMLAGGTGFGVHLWRNHLIQPEAGLWGALTGPAPAIAPLSLANLGLMLLVAVWLARSRDRA